MKFSLLAVLLASPAAAGPFTAAAPVGRSALPLPPGMFFSPALSPSLAPLVTPSFLVTPSAVSLTSVLPSPALPTLTPALPAAVRPLAIAAAMPAAAAAPQAAASAKAAGAVVRASLAETAGAIAQSKPSQRHGAASAASNALFDGMKARSAVNGVAAFSRPPDWSEDRRINAAIAKLNESSVGRDIYANIYQNHPGLRIVVDDAPGANYDARLTRDAAGRPILNLTESLVDRQSAETVAAYMAREMSDLYFESFPASAERGYLSYSNMARVFAELTGSGLRSNGYWWNTSKDQYSDGRYAMQSYYGSWREAVIENATIRKDIRDSAFFQFLQGRDDSNTDPRAKLSLYQQYRRGLITRATYNEMNNYFFTFAASESNWLNNSGRW